MAIEPAPAVSDPVDPLRHHRALAQFPKTYNLPPVSNDLDSIHNAAKSLGAKNPEEVLEEAKKIVDGGSELLNTNYTAFTASMGFDEAFQEKENEKPQERRPGLGRRRPKFTIKRNLSQPPANLLTSFDGSKFPDPDEFFAEYEKHENAQNEIKRLMGISCSIDEDNIPPNALRRSPGILGNNRRSVTYKDRYAQVISKKRDNLVSSPDLTELTIPKPPNNNSGQGNSETQEELQENDAAGSITKAEHEVNMLLDELLSSNSEDLDGYGAVSLLQKRLDIKPIELSTLSIPNFKATERIDYADIGKNFPKPRRSSFAVENFKQRTPLSQKQMERSANSSLESSTPRSLSSTPRSLLGSLSALRKRVMQSNPLEDLFSPLDTDLMVPRNSQPDEGSEPTEQNNGIGERSTGASLAGIGERSTGASLAGMSKIKSPSSKSSHIDASQDISHISFLVHDGGNDMDGNMDHIYTENAGNDMDCPPQEIENVEDSTDLPMSSVVGVERTENHISPIDDHELSQMEDNVEYTPNLPMSSVEGLKRTENDTVVSPIDNHEPSQMEENIQVEAMPFAAQEDISSKESMIHDKLEVDQRSFDEPHADAAKECTSEMLPTARVSISEQETQKLPSKDQGHTRRTTVGISERKSLSKRQSILDGGTTFECGVRRSKRIKTRPLEYWRGERLLYSRVNGSIKLTGLQYISPSKDNGVLKVKSFVEQPISVTKFRSGKA